MTQLSAHDQRYIARHAAEYDPEFDDMDSLSAAWQRHLDELTGKRKPRPRRERSLADISLMVDRLIVERGLTAQKLADATGMHRSTIERMRAGMLGGRPSVEKILKYMAECEQSREA